jgi:hypothetical protein
MTGLNNIRLRVTDSNGEYDEESVTVTVSNPSVASIIAWSPTDNPVVVRTDEVEVFSITPDGTPPFVTTWSISPGGAVAGCPTGNSCSIAGGGVYVGSHVLTASMTDASASPAVTRDFNVIFNSKPTVSPASITPSNASVIKRNCSSEVTFSATIVDSNYSDPGQTHTVVWRIDGIEVPSADLTITTNTGTHPFTSSAIYKPKCLDSYLGAKVLSMTVSDGFENETISWNVETSFLSEACMNLSAGQICTLAGVPSMLKGTDMSSVANSKYASMMPAYIEAHPDGGLFISDYFNHVVWFYNNNSVGNITVFGQVVLPKNLIVLVGTGSAGLGISGESLTNFYLNTPLDVAWDDANEALYISDGGNNRVVKMSAGVGTQFAGGALTADGAAAELSRCQAPSGLELIGNKLYVACSGNTTNNEGHVKYFTTDTNLAYTVARYSNGGTNAAGTINGTGTTARVRQVHGLAKHPTKDIVFGSDLTQCKVFVLNSDSNDTFLGIAVNSNRMEVLTGNTACGNAGTGHLNTNAGGRLRSIDLKVKSNGAVVEGLFLSQWQDGGVVYLNFAGTTTVLGNNSVESFHYRPVFGAPGNNYSRGTPAFTNSAMNYPRGMVVVGNTLYVADTRNGRIGHLDIGTPNGAVDDLIQSDIYFGYDGEVDLPTQEQRLNRPSAIAYSASNNEIIFGDMYNGRIRSINLNNGRIRTKIGNGSFASTASSPLNRFSTPVYAVHDLQVVAGNSSLLFTDVYSNSVALNANINPTNYGAGTNRSCFVRALNESGASNDFWGQSTGDGFVSNVAGIYSLGCNIWDVAYESSPATSSRLHRPTGIGALDDGSLLWVTNRDHHCIQEVDSAGIITTKVGLCGSAGDLAGDFSSARLTSPGDIEIDPDPSYAGTGNFFFIDRAFTTASTIKYVNFSGAGVDFDGDTAADVASGQVAKFIAATDGYVAGIAAYANWVCYSQGLFGSGSDNAQNVICRTRNQAQTFRIGKPSTPTASPYIRGKKAILPTEQEAIAANQASLDRPWGITFDGDGNLYISDYGNNVIRMVKKWW